MDLLEGGLTALQEPTLTVLFSVDVSDFFFRRSEEGKEESEAPGRGGGRFSTENPRRKGGLPGGGRGLEGVCGELGGGVNIFFGAEMPTKSWFCLI